MDRDYKFFRQPLTKKVAEALILEQIPRDKGFTNSEITEIVVRHHEKLGGLPGKSTYISRDIIKPVLGKLKKAGSIRNPIKATWLIPGNAGADYAFYGMRLTTKVAKNIILERLQPDEGFTNSEITEIVVEHHESLGGLPRTTPLAYISRYIIKPALGDLKKADLIRNPIHDTWLIPGDAGADYAFYGIRLAPTVMRALILDYLPRGEDFKRDELYNFICEKHVSLGGIAPKKAHTKHSLKDVLIKLKKQGLVTNPEQGLWSVCSPSSVDVPAGLADEELGVVSSSAILADEELGVGSGAVYVYYYPNYREMALSKGESIWACKIGKSVVDAYGRVKSQTGTAMPECPHIALVLNTDFENDLETVIHLTLKIRGQCLDSAPGKEWFITNPAEVKAIYAFIV